MIQICICSQIALFALIAVALAAPKPEPAPQAVFYNGLDYVSPYSSFGGYPAAASLYQYPGAGVLPYAAYPGAYFVKK